MKNAQLVAVLCCAVLCCASVAHSHSRVKPFPHNNRNILYFTTKSSNFKPHKRKICLDCVQNFHTLFVQDDNEAEDDLLSSRPYHMLIMLNLKIPFLCYTLVIRSGNSTACELYFRWTGTHVISMISFSNMKIQSTSLLSPTIYSNIGGSTIYCSPAAVAGTAKILDISIPTNVSKVRAVVTSPMMCSLSDGWLSLTSINSTVTIN